MSILCLKTLYQQNKFYFHLNFVLIFLSNLLLVSYLEHSRANYKISGESKNEISYRYEVGTEVVHLDDYLGSQLTHSHYHILAKSRHNVVFFVLCLCHIADFFFLSVLLCVCIFVCLVVNLWGYFSLVNHSLQLLETKWPICVIFKFGITKVN